MGKTKGNSGPFGIPQGEVTSDVPCSVSKTMGNTVVNSTYDADWIYEGQPHGAFDQKEDYGFVGPDYGRRSNGSVTEPYKK